ncbi:MAG TPA: hypothetical protein VFB54_16335, partial [Burkholderiales bacterium]|nr:hypothetical protein [Burkholderiales bacterium]
MVFCKAIRLGLCLTMSAAATCASAALCGILPEGRARLAVDQREMNVDAATRLDPCQGKLRLIEGKAVLTFARRPNQNTYRSLKPKEVVDLDALGVEGAVSVPLDRIVAFFKSGRQIEAVTAMSRAGERLTGFPYDDIWLPKQPMRWRLLEWRDKKIKDFLLHPRGKPEQVLLHVAEQADGITVPLSTLTEGADYTWVAVLSDGEQYIGKFHTLGREQAQRIEQQLDEVERDDSLGELSRRTLIAIVFDQ